MSREIRTLAGLIVGYLVFCWGFFINTDVALPIAAGIPAIFAVIAYWGTYLAVPRPLTEYEKLSLQGFASDIQTIVSPTLGHISAIRVHAKALAPQRQRALEELMVIADKIVNSFKDDPSEAHRSRSFLYTYLPELRNAVASLAKARTKHQEHEAVEKLALEFDDTVVEMKDLFQQQYDHNLSDDMSMASAQLTVLRKMKQIEGI